MQFWVQTMQQTAEQKEAASNLMMSLFWHVSSVGLDHSYIVLGLVSDINSPVFYLHSDFSYSICTFGGLTFLRFFFFFFVIFYL